MPFAQLYSVQSWSILAAFRLSLWVSSLHRQLTSCESSSNAFITYSGTIVHGTIVIVMLFWRPHPDSPYVFYAMAGLWGVGDAVWQTQINGKSRDHPLVTVKSRSLIGIHFVQNYLPGLYGLLFRRNKEAAFSNYRLWESAGFVIAYACSTALCARMKLYVLFGNLVLGIIGYVIVEIRHRRKVNETIKHATFDSNKFTERHVFFFFCDLWINRNVDLRNRKPKKTQPVKLRPLNNKKSKKPTTKKTIWKKTLKSHISKWDANVNCKIIYVRTCRNILWTKNKVKS